MAYLFSGYLIAGTTIIEDIFRWNYIDGYELSSMKIQDLAESWNHPPSFKLIPDSDSNYVIKIIFPNTRVYVLDPQISTQPRMNFMPPSNIQEKVM